MLANYQQGVKGSVNGGNGFLRIVTLHPKENTISVQTYSPWLKEYKSGPEHQFVFREVNLNP